MTEPVARHWIVAAAEGEAVIASEQFALKADAYTHARALAAADPGDVFVIYEAIAWAAVDPSPVSVKPVVITT